MDENIQDRNVGNRGDVVKHIALVALADLLRARNPGLVRHVETHTFRLFAPLPERAPSPGGGALNRAPAPPPPDHASARYEALQAPWLARGLYRCSAGLAADALGAPLRLLLAEAHGPTRAALAAALAAESLPVDTLADDALAFATLTTAHSAPLLVHVDPFDHPARYWPAVSHLLSTWRRPGQDAVVLSFAYDKHAPIAWPPPPADLVSLGRLDYAPYGLAAWASAGIAPPARAALEALGFTPG
jgi:hypothetical protein